MTKEKYRTQIPGVDGEYKTKVGKRHGQAYSESVFVFFDDESDDIPTEKWKNDDIKGWLDDRGIEYEESFTKAELLQLV